MRLDYLGPCGSLLGTIEGVAMTSREGVVALLKEYLGDAILLKDFLASEALM